MKNTFAKRFKITKKGKIVSRRPGQNHFRAKKRRRNELAKKRIKLFLAPKKQLGRYFGK